MHELSQIEVNDADLRHYEGGGAIPTEMHGLGADTNPAPDPVPDVWYKNKTFLSVVGLGAVLALGVTLYAMNKKDAE